MWLFAQQFVILLWKCGILRKRHYITTAFEFILPLLTSSILTIIIAKTNVNTGGSPTSTSVPAQWKNYATFEYPRGLSDFKYGTKIMYAPKGDFSGKLVNAMKAILSKEVGEENSAEFIEFDNENEIVDFYLKSKGNQSLAKYFGIVIDGDEPMKKFSYTVRCEEQDMADPNQLYSPYTFPRWYSSYTNYFSKLQIWVNEAYLNIVTESLTTKSTRNETSTVKGFMYPYPAYDETRGMNSMGMLSLFVVMGFIVTAPIIVKRLADEKTSRCREMYRLMSLNDWVFWGSTFLNYFIVYFLQAIILTFLYCYKFNGNSAVFNYANPLLIFFMFLVYGISFIIQSLFISIPLNRPVIGVVVTILFWVASYIVPVIFLDLTVGPDVDVRTLNSGRIAACLLPNTAMYFIFRLISERDSLGIETDFGNLYTEVAGLGQLTFGIILTMMIVSCVIYGVLIWYLEAVWPWQYGVPKPVYFPLLPSYWCGNRKQTLLNDDNIQKSNKFFERQMSLAEVAVNVKHLRKEFGVGFSRKVAINDASLDILRGQITVLLGHNGAGKTTMMNIITGMFTPTGGNVFVDGFDITTQTKKARGSMSLCPQHNATYDELTVGEHLKLFTAIKGTKWSLLDDTVEKCTRQLNLVDKLNVQSAALSGGMKRKLNLGIALIGDTSIVILDEPTSGMDPDARRSVWDLLQSIRKERTILITTHFMEEADALADRIAIMVDGEVKCCGTPMFLKAAFGNGYQLRIAKRDSFKGEEVNACVTLYFPQASVVSETDSEIVYRLEDSIKSTANNVSEFLPQFFNEFEAKKENLGISSCGLSVTTIEDVFLGVHSEKNDTEEQSQPLLTRFPRRSDNNESPLDSSTIEIAGQSDKLTGLQLFLQQLKALHLKRLHFSKRYLPMFLFQLIIPGLIFGLLLVLDSRTMGNTQPSEPRKLLLSLGSIYGKTTAYFQSTQQLEKYKKPYEVAAKDESATTIFLDSTVNLTEAILNASKSMTVKQFKRKYIVGASVANSSFNVFYNSEVYHSLPTSINVLYNAILKDIISPNFDNSISLSVQSFINSRDSFDQSLNMNRVMALIWSFIVPVTLPFLAASYVLFPIHERESKSKLLQLMSGVSPALFWLANFIFDFATHLICCCVILAIFGTLDKYGLFTNHSQTVGALFLLMFFFGFACIPLAYAASFMFKSTGTGFAVLVILFAVFGIILSPVDFTLRMAIAPEKYKIFEWFARLSPIISLTKGILNIREVSSIPALCERLSPDYLSKRCEMVQVYESIFGCCKDKCGPVGRCYERRDLFSWNNNVVNAEILMLFVDSVIFILLLCLLEKGVNRLFNYISNKLRNSSMYENLSLCELRSIEDNDVKKEATRVARLLNNLEMSEDSLIVHNLRKEYNNRCCGCIGSQNLFLAVKKLCFAVQNRECFGLLGVNGAGKTTTFRMLVGDLMPTNGNAYCCGANIQYNYREFQKNIGYCPQFDALLDKLTGSETLYLFGRLRGIPENNLSETVKELIVMTNLGKHSEKRTDTYSGGTRRKLSLAIALIGNPKLLFLDEPTSGVDPGARRIIWKTLANIREVFGCSLVLTSHSMDECEVLCNRIAIMVNGEFKCLGNFQYLRSKFGQGFTLKIKTKRTNLKADYIESVKRYVSTVITSAALKDLSETVFEYHISDVTLPWSKLFAIMSDMKQQFDMEDYTISDATLEQIFISFARQQYS